MLPNIKAHIQGYDKLKSSIEGVKAKAEKANRNTIRDMKSRAPGWVASAVTKRYNIKKGEITPTSKNAKNPQHKSASVAVKGDTIEALSFVYKGRLLTPVRFSMKPRQRPKSNRPYQVSAEIIKGQKKNFPKQVFLTQVNSGTLPFQRKGGSRFPIESIKTLSVPQMVTQEDVATEISGALNKGLEERLNHNIKRQGL